VSPHIGGSTVEAQERVGAEIAQKVVKAFSAQEHA
jgi:phosphoglycerate dehydrogenase-like enzyme